MNKGLESKINAIILPGNSSENRNWLPLVANILQQKNYNLIEIHYKHWETGNELIDFREETLRLAEIAKKVNPFIIVAKSAGVILCLKAIAERLIKPKRAIFLGFPLSWAKELKLPFDDWLPKLIIPTIFFQQTDDPVGSASEVFTYLKTKVGSQCSFRELTGSDHWYGEQEFQLVKET